MTELEEDDIGSHESESFETSQENDNTTALNPTQLDYVCFKFIFIQIYCHTVNKRF